MFFHNKCFFFRTERNWRSNVLCHSFGRSCRLDMEGSIPPPVFIILLRSSKHENPPHKLNNFTNFDESLRLQIKLWDFKILNTVKMGDSGHYQIVGLIICNNCVNNFNLVLIVCYVCNIICNVSLHNLMLTHCVFHDDLVMRKKAIRGHYMIKADSRGHRGSVGDNCARACDGPDLRRPRMKQQVSCYGARRRTWKTLYRLPRLRNRPPTTGYCAVRYLRLAPVRGDRNNLHPLLLVVSLKIIQYSL